MNNENQPENELDSADADLEPTGSDEPAVADAAQPEEVAAEVETEAVSGAEAEAGSDVDVVSEAGEGETDKAESVEADEETEAVASSEDAEHEGLDLAAIFEAQPLERILESMIGSSRGSLSIDRMITALGDHAPEKSVVRAALARLAEDCASRSVELKETASGFRFQVRQDFAPWVARLTEEKPQRYSRAALETLALIAYRQPITRGEIEQVRGVAVSTNIIRTLEERNWVRVVGHKDVPGRPALFATTREFLDYFGMKTLTELPSLEAVKDLDALGEKLAELGAGVSEAAFTDGIEVAADGEAAEMRAESVDAGESDTEIETSLAGAEAVLYRESQEASVSSAVEAAMAMDIGMTLEPDADGFPEDDLEAGTGFEMENVFAAFDPADEADSDTEVVSEDNSEPVPG